MKTTAYEVEFTLCGTIVVDVEDADMERRELQDLIFEEVQLEVDAFQRSDSLTVDSFKEKGSDGD